MDIQLIGSRLLFRGFKDWFLFIFKKIEGKPFIVEAIHEDLFNVIKKVHNLESLRLIINICPRSAKTTLLTYFIAYTFAINPKCEFIYTGYSQDLLTSISGRLKGILDHHIYKSMYIENIRYEEQKEEFTDDFWSEYYKGLEEKKGNKNAVYTSKKIITSSGGVVLFASVGSQILGNGCGIRGAKEFSGGLFLDDPNKSSDIYSKVLRDRTLRYYEETLLTRLNDSNVPIVIVQQRLHIEDLTGLILNRYSNYEVLKKPLFIDGVCQLPSQYSADRIKEIKTNETMFLAQYQQEPIIDGGCLFKKHWFDFRDEIPDLKEYDTIFATIDTAMNDKNCNDYTACSVWGIIKNKLYLIDVLREKIVSIHLPDKIQKFLERFADFNLHYVWIENKQSGMTLNQGFREYGGFIKIPKEEELKEYLNRTKCKPERANEITPFINEYDKNIIINNNILNLEDLISELLAFDKGSHDDFVDTLTDAIYLFEKYYKKRNSNIIKAIDNMKFLNF